MPYQSPNQSDLHVDALLTNVSLAYRNPNYMSDDLFPLCPVKKQSDIVTKFDQSHWFRDDAKLRLPGAKSVRGGYTVDTSDHYFCNRYAIGREITDEQRDNADSVFNLDREATDWATDKVQMRRERNFSSGFFKTGVWGGGDPTGGTDFTRWSDYSNSSPLVDLTTYRDNMEALIGVEPNKCVLGKQVWTKLKWHPDLIDTIKYTQKGQLSVELFTALAEFNKVHIGRGIYTASPEGTAEASVVYTRIWGKSALLLYTPAAPSLMTPAAGYTFVWQRVAAAAQYIKRLRDEEREVDIIEANSYFDQHLTAKNAGVFLSGAVA